MRKQRVLTRSRGTPETLPDPPLRCADPACRLEFTPSRPWHRYHSPRCRARHWLRRKHSPPQPADLSAVVRRTKAEARLPRVPPRATRGRTKAGLTIHCVVELI